MKQLLFLMIFTFQFAQADNLLDVLDGKTKSDGLSVVKKASLFKNLVPRPTAEQNIFLQFLEKGEFNKALYQWPSAFEGKSFSRTANGKALYGYLLFQNNLQIVGLETLFLANPRSLKPRMVKLWQGIMQENEDLWAFTNLRWNSKWTKIFGLAAEVTVVARRFDSRVSTAQLESLLRRTTTGTWERSWTEWSYVTSLVGRGKDIKAAKILKHLQTVKENNPVSQNLMNLTVARILYQNGFLNEAIKYYGKVEKKSDYWFEAQEEMGWSYVRLGQPQNTMAISQTLMTPAFSSDVGPETFYLTSLAQLKTCDYLSLTKLLKEFRSRFQAKAGVLVELRKNAETPATKKLVSSLRKGRIQMPQLGASGNKLPRYSTRDEHLYYLVQREKKLAQEATIAKKLYSRSLSEGTALVGFQAKMEKFKKAVESRSRTSYTAALNRVQELANLEIKEISDVLKKMQIVEAELIQQLSMAERVIKDTKGQKIAKKSGSTGSKASDALQFPFQGEIWFDELANYKVDIAKGCQSGKGKTL